MDQITQKSKRKKSKKPATFLLLALIFFGVFIYFLARPSTQSTAIAQIEACSNVREVKEVFDKYKFELLDNTEDGKKVVSSDFQLAIRNKLNSFDLTQEQIIECIEWLPPAPANLNIIVIPDLSRRLTDGTCPNQVASDKFVLNTIWESFVEFSKLKKDSKDKLMVDVTDIDQAKGQFESIANNLVFDLSEHTGKSNRLYFTPEKDKQFSDGIDNLYSSAIGKPLGCDYRFYLRRYLSNHLKNPNLYEDFVNKVIIITDGYLEPENGPADTKLGVKYTKALHKGVNNGDVLGVINQNGLNIPKVDIDLSNTEVLVCEIYERQDGKGYDFEILKAYWEDWFTRMGAKEFTFIQRQQANTISAEAIKNFILH